MVVIALRLIVVCWEVFLCGFIVLWFDGLACFGGLWLDYCVCIFVVVCVVGIVYCYSVGL